MKKNKSLKIAALSVVTMMLIIILIACTNVQHKKSTQKQKAKPLVIEEKKTCTNGCLTIYDNKGNVLYQYLGEINLINDGRNGEKIEIVVHLPDSGHCNCVPIFY